MHNNRSTAAPLANARTMANARTAKRQWRLHSDQTRNVQAELKRLTIRAATGRPVAQPVKRLPSKPHTIRVRIHDGHSHTHPPLRTTDEGQQPRNTCLVLSHSCIYTVTRKPHTKTSLYPPTAMRPILATVKECLPMKAAGRGLVHPQSRNSCRSSIEQS
jgi:hypothetical protein